MNEQPWHDAIGFENGDHVTLKTRYGLIRIERINDYRGQMFSLNGASEGLHLTLSSAIETAIRELAVLQQGQRA